MATGHWKTEWHGRACVSCFAATGRETVKNTPVESNVSSVDWVSPSFTWLLAQYCTAISYCNHAHISIY